MNTKIMKTYMDENKNVTPPSWFKSIPDKKLDLFMKVTKSKYELYPFMDALLHPPFTALFHLVFVLFPAVIQCY